MFLSSSPARRYALRAPRITAFSDCHKHRPAVPGTPRCLAPPPGYSETRRMTFREAEAVHLTGAWLAPARRPEV